VRIRPVGLTDLAGQEQRFYREAGKVVSLSWFAGLATEAQVRDKVAAELSGLDFLSLAALEREAEEEGRWADFDALAAPATTPGRPPVIAAGRE